VTVSSAITAEKQRERDEQPLSPSNSTEGRNTTHLGHLGKPRQSDFAGWGTPAAGNNT
jgi:hypothetical protein